MVLTNIKIYCRRALVNIEIGCGIIIDFYDYYVSSSLLLFVVNITLSFVVILFSGL